MISPLPTPRPIPCPAGSRLLQDLGFLAFTLPQVEILMPTKKPRGQELTLEQQRGQPGAAPASAADRACQQQCQALPHRERPDPPVEGGRPRSGDGTLLCPAQLPGAPHALATNGLIGINSNVQNTLVGSATCGLPSCLERKQDAEHLSLYEVRPPLSPVFHSVCGQVARAKNRGAINM